LIVSAQKADAIVISFDEGVYGDGAAVAVGPYVGGVSISSVTGAASTIQGPGGPYTGYDDSHYLQVSGGSSVTFTFPSGSTGFSVHARPLEGDSFLQWSVQEKNGPTNLGSTTWAGGPDLNWYTAEQDAVFNTVILSCFSNVSNGGLRGLCGFDSMAATLAVSSVPEVSSLAFLATGLLLGAVFWRRGDDTALQSVSFGRLENHIYTPLTR